MEKQLLQARLAKQEKKEVMDEISLDKRYILLKNQVDHLQKENSLLKETIKQKDCLDLDAIIESNVVLGDLLDKFINRCNEFRPETINLALQIKSISPKSYDLLVRNLNFPSISYIEKKFKENISNFPQKLTNINGICDIISQWKSKFDIPKSQNIRACLAVDALYFKPDFAVTIDNCISGAIIIYLLGLIMIG